MKENIKYHELIKYICAKVPNLSKTKLFKILFFCDFTAFRELGESISGDTYIRQPHGPVPTHAMNEINSLLETNDIAFARTNYNGFSGEKLVLLTNYNLDVFTPNQVSLMDSRIDLAKRKTAKYFSEKSHEFIGWKVTKDGENIPYGTILLQVDEAPEFEFPKEYIDNALNNAKDEFKKLTV